MTMNVKAGLLFASLVSVVSSVIASDVVTVTIRSPIDGFLTDIAKQGSHRSGTTAAARQHYEAIREAISKIKPLDLSSPVSRKAAAAEDSLCPASETPKSPSLSEKDRLFRVRSELLEIQLEIEKRKLATACQRLHLAKLNASYQAAQTAKEQQVQASRSAIAIDSANITEWQGVRSGHADPTNIGRSMQRNAANAATFQNEFFVLRKDNQQELELLRIQIAGQELEQAQKAVELMEATLKLGEVSCPKRCRVVRVHLVENQYVSKGDKVVDVQFVSTK